MESSMTRRAFAWIMALFAAFAVSFAIAPGTAQAADDLAAGGMAAQADDVVFTVYTQIGTGPVSKTEYTQADLDKMAKDNKSMSYDYAAKKNTVFKTGDAGFVTLRQVLGVTKPSKPTIETGQTLRFVTADGELDETSGLKLYTKAEFNYQSFNAPQYFFPEWNGTSYGTENAVEVDPVIAWNYGDAAIEEGANAGTTAAAITTKAQDGLRFFVGAKESDYKEKNVPAGKQSPSGVTGVLISTPVPDELAVAVKGSADTEARTVKNYNYETLMAMADSNAKGFLFNKSGWQVAATSHSVAISALLADAGITVEKDDKVVAEAADGFTSTYTYDQLTNSKYFYPATTENAEDPTDPVEVGAVVALDWISGNVQGTAADTVEKLAGEKKSEQYRCFIGLSKEDYLAKENVGGNRFATGVVKITVEKAAATKLTEENVTGVNSTYYYTGKAIEPAIAVKIGDAALVKDTDYTVKYADNTDASLEPVATVTVTGKGSFAGEVVKKFAIVQFADTEGHWALDDGGRNWIKEATDMGLMGGYKTDGKLNGQFGPDDQIKRQDIAVMLYRSANPDSKATTDPEAYAKENTSGWEDCEGGQYYTAAMNWAKEAKVFTGDSSTDYKTVRPGDSISREELALVYSRYADGAGKKADGSYKKAAPDADKVSEWATAGIDWCYTNGVMTGNKETKALNPGDTATRAETAKMTVTTVNIKLTPANAE